MLDFPLTRTLLTVAAIGSGIIGGVFFAFSTFIMAAFGQIPNGSGIAAMNAINRVILRSAFMPIFVGMVVIALILVVIAIRNWDWAPGSFVIAGAALYILASFISTIMFNVPLNDQLATITGSAAGDSAIWLGYLKDWTFWNHVRTAASLLASLAFMAAMR